MKNKIIIIGALLAIICTMSAFVGGGVHSDDFKPQNLQILPQNITKDALDSTMHSFNTALGVKCNFCHAPKDNGEQGLDFTSDSKHHKIIARHMMQMVDSINKQYFDPHARNGIAHNITCQSCHNGQKEPFTIEKTIEQNK